MMKNLVQKFMPSWSISNDIVEQEHFDGACLIQTLLHRMSDHTRY